MEAAKLFLSLFLLTLALYGLPTLVLRAVEFALLRRWSRRKPKAPAFVGLHGLSLLVIAVFTPALCYLVGGQVMRALGFAAVSDFNGSTEMWATYYLISVALPLQFHYTVNSKLCGEIQEDGEHRVEPRRLVWVWSVLTLAAVTLAWLPLWLGWVDMDLFGATLGA